MLLQICDLLLFCRYVSALTGVVSVILFLPCIFKEFSTQNRSPKDEQAEDDTAETLNIAEVGTTDQNSNSQPPKNIKGSALLRMLLTYDPYNLINLLKALLFPTLL